MSKEWASPNAWRAAQGYSEYEEPIFETEKDMSLTTVLISVIGGAFGGIIGRVLTDWYESKR